jgi:hypothetical protein
LRRENTSAQAPDGTSSRNAVVDQMMNSVDTCDVDSP